jgi:hypothetical protein
MANRLTFIILALMVPALGGWSQIIDPVSDFPVSFGEKALKHIAEIHRFGARTSGSPAAGKTEKYIASAFKKAGLTVTADTFSYRYFDLQKKTVEFDGQPFTPKNIVYDPYDTVLDHRGKFVFFFPDSAELRQINQGFENKIIVTKESANFVRLAYKQPRAILIYEKKVFDSLARMKPGELFIRLEGPVVSVRSVNIVGTLAPPHADSSSILLTAHWDSYPGRNSGDNASGVATLIELARYFGERRDRLTTTLKFVATGAGEMGMLGAIRYVEDHRAELKHCMLDFNLDEVSGLHDIYMEVTGGIENISPEKGVIKQDIYWKGRSIRGLHDDWIWIGDIPMASNVPEKLHHDILATCNALFLKINQVSGMGSDHQIFSLAGIPSTSISIDNDSAPKNDKDSLREYPEGPWMAGRIAAGVVVQTMKKP